MADPFKVLADKIAQFRFSVADIPDAMIPDVVSAIAAEQTKTIDASQDAYGVPWAPKKSGDPAFSFVSSSDVQVGAAGRVVFIRIKSRVPVLHHFGHAKGHVTRAVIPVAKMPPAWSRRLLDIANRKFAEATS